LRDNGLIVVSPRVSGVSLDSSRDDHRVGVSGLFLSVAGAEMSAITTEKGWILDSDGVAAGRGRGALGSVDVRMRGKEQGLASPYPVICHLLDVAAMAGCVWDAMVGPAAARRIAGRLGVPADAVRGLVMFWAGLHDLGKISPPFQERIRGLAALTRDGGYSYLPLNEHSRRLSHHEATQLILSRLFTELGYAPSGSSTARWAAQMLGGHHGTFHDFPEPGETKDPWHGRGSGLGGEEWRVQTQTHLDALARCVGPDARVVPSGRFGRETLGVVAGIVILADWLASQVGFISARLPGPQWAAGEAELAMHWSRSMADAPGVVQVSGIGRVRFRPVSDGVAGFTERFGIETPYPLQASLARELSSVASGAGMLMLVAPPGDGKTECALYGAAQLARVSGAEGIAFVLPTRVTADAMIERIGSFGKTNVEGAAGFALVHGHAWLSSKVDQIAQASVSGDEVVTHAEGQLYAAQWLRERHKGLMAGLCALTIDQALLAVLPTRFNVLRMTALANKVVVIDEAHALDAWQHQLVVLLLEWLGALRVPVVVMSATLSGRLAGSLVRAYRRGAKHNELPEIMVPYPGWVFVDAETGEACEPRQVDSRYRSTLHMTRVPVRRVHQKADKQPPIELTPQRVVSDLLGPIASEGGCALVVCNTVDESQAMYDEIARRFCAEEHVQVTLLHSRFSAGDRDRITESCAFRFGKPEKEHPDKRPFAAVMIATQIVEQSIDLDFDLVVTDLTLIAWLFQRAGRCRRHERGSRPAWMSRFLINESAADGDAGPRVPLVVLDPVGGDGDFLKPQTWGDVYAEDLLRSTRSLLVERDKCPIDIPGDVQEMVDEVYGRSFAAAIDDDGFGRAVRERLGREAAERLGAEMVGIPSPNSIQSLRELSCGSAGQVDEEMVTTRLGVESLRLVPVFTHSDRGPTLDAEGLMPLPGADGRDVSVDDVRTVLLHAIPVPHRWFEPHTADARPIAWEKNPALRRLVCSEGATWRGEGELAGWRGRLGGVRLEYDARRGMSRFTSV
jgi:CRISPR-associated endonuclease/helicase Cas3